jgi:TP901 family phage tail tape measure protein
VVGRAAAGAGTNISGSISLTGVNQFLTDTRKIIAAYKQVENAALSASRAVTASAVARATPATSRTGAGGIRPRVGGFVGARAGAGPFQTALGVGGFGAGFASAAVAGATALGVGIAAVTSNVLKLGAAFQESQREVQVFGNSSNAEIESLNKAVLQLSITWGVSAQSISQAAVSLVKAGATIDQINGGLLEQVVILNRASKGEVEMARGADILVQLMTLFEPKIVTAAEKTRDYAQFNIAAAKTVDTLVGAVQSSTVGWEEFILQAKNVAPVGALLGFTLEDVATQLAVLNQAGIRGETAGTALRNSWIRMIKPTKEAAEAMDQFGLGLFKTDGTIVDAEEAVAQLERAFGREAVESGRITEAARAQGLARIFNTRQILASITAAEQGTEAFDRMKKAIQGVNARQIAADLQFGINAQLGLLQAAAEAAGLALFNGLEVPLTNLLKVINQFATNTGFFGFFTDLGKSIGDIISLNNEFVNTWIKLAAVQDTLLFQAISNIITVLGRLGSAILGQGAGINSATDALNALGNATITISAILAVATEELIKTTDAAIQLASSGIAALISGFQSLASGQALSQLGSALQNFVDQALQDFVNGWTQRLAAAQEGVNEFIQGVVDLFNLTPTLILGPLNAVIDGVVLFGTFLVNNWQAIGQAVIEVLRFIGHEVIVAWEAVSEFFSSNWETILKTFADAAKILAEIAGQVVLGILGPFGFLANALVDLIFNAVLPSFDALVEGITAIVEPIVTSIIDIVKGWAGALQRWVQMVVDAANKILSALAKIAGVGKFLPGPLGAVFQAVDAAATAIGQINNGFQVSLEGLGGTIPKIAKGVASAAAAGAKTITDAVDNFGKQVQARVEVTRASIDEAFAKFRGSLNQPRPAPVERPGAAPTTRAPGGGLASNVPAGGGGGKRGAKEAAEDVDVLAQRIFDALRGIIPAMTKDLAEFMAGIAHDFPSRLQPMIDSLVEARGIIGQMVLLKTQMLSIDLELIGVERRLTDLNAQQHRLQLQADIASVGFDKQLLRLGFQKLQIERQMWPLEDAIRDIDEQINKLQQENLVLKRAQLEIQLQELPIKQRIEDIDKEINKLQRTNLVLAAERLRWEALQIPLKRQVEDIDRQIANVGQRNFALERESLELTKRQLPIQRQIQVLQDQITDSVDKRQQILNKRAELIAQRDVSKLNQQLKSVTDELDKAWTDFDVPKILKLEESKRLLEEQLKAAQANLDRISTGQEDAQRETDIANTELELQIAALEELNKPLERRQQVIENTQAVQENLNAITKLGLEEQKAAIEAMLLPLETLILAVDRAAEDEQFRAKVTINGLEQEKRALEEQLEPLDNKLLAIQRQIDAENIRNQITITHLEEEKRRLEDQLKPLEDQRRAIERSTKEIQFQRTEARQAFEEAITDLKSQILQEDLHKASLEETRLKQAEVFQQLSEEFSKAITDSGAFTFQESLEVAKRLKMWDDQNNKLHDTVLEFIRLKDEANNAADAIRNIPDVKDVTIRIHEEHVGGGGGGGGGGAQPAGNTGGGLRPVAPADAQNFQFGGIVRGKFGQPMWVIAHAGERILPLRTVPNRSDFIKSREARTGTTNIVYNNITNFEVNPSYSTVQSPISIREDLRALVMAMR